MLDENEPDSFQVLAVLICIAYFVILVGSLLLMEYRSVAGDMKKLTCSFWILFGFTWIIMFGVGAAAVALT